MENAIGLLIGICVALVGVGHIAADVDAEIRGAATSIDQAAR